MLTFKQARKAVRYEGLRAVARPRAAMSGATKPPRCQALDQHAKRCRNAAARVVRYHGSDELYGWLTDTGAPQWVRVLLCERHSKNDGWPLRRAEEPR